MQFSGRELSTRPGRQHLVNDVIRLDRIEAES